MKMFPLTLISAALALGACTKASNSHLKGIDISLNEDADQLVYKSKAKSVDSPDLVIEKPGFSTVLPCSFVSYGITWTDWDQYYAKDYIFTTLNVKIGKDDKASTFSVFVPDDKENRRILQSLADIASINGKIDQMVLTLTDKEFAKSRDGNCDEHGFNKLVDVNFTIGKTQKYHNFFGQHPNLRSAIRTLPASQDFQDPGLMISPRNLSGKNGAFVKSVIKDMPAFKAGIAAGDSIVGLKTMEDKEFSPINTGADFPEVLGKVVKNVKNGSYLLKVKMIKKASEQAAENVTEVELNLTKIQVK